MLVGQTKLILCTTNPSGLSVSWSSNNPSVATVSSTGVVTGISEGNVKITASYVDTATGTTSYDYVYLYVKESIGIKDDTNYYVMNYSSKRYLSLESASDTNYTNVCTNARSASTLFQWKTEKQADGRTQLISVYSPSGKALDITEQMLIFTLTMTQLIKSSTFTALIQIPTKVCTISDMENILWRRMQITMYI